MNHNMLPLTRNDLIKKLEEFFKKQNSVKLAYLFGSSVTEKRGKLSDIDIAVLFDDHLGKKERFKLELELIGKLSSLLKTNKIDLVIMNEATILMNYNIIKGIALIGEESVRIKTETAIISKYLDRKPHIQRYALETIKKVAEQGLK